MKDRFFLDSNIWLYLNEKDLTDKKIRAQNFLYKNACTSPQIIFECINVCKKKFRFILEQSLDFSKVLLENCEVLTEGIETVELAIFLLRKYSLQPFDAKIVATALFHNCKILYSEDLQNGIMIEGKLTIVNPFLNK
jgi:predicted nucleic acid-binding protein